MTSANDTEDEKSQTQNKLLQLPLSRVKTIMKSSPDLGNVSQEALFLICRATELFVQHVATETYKNSTNKSSLNYKSLGMYRSAVCHF